MLRIPVKAHYTQFSHHREMGVVETNRNLVDGDRATISQIVFPFGDRRCERLEADRELSVHEDVKD